MATHPPLEQRIQRLKGAANYAPTSASRAFRNQNVQTENPLVSGLVESRTQIKSPAQVSIRTVAATASSQILSQLPEGLQNSVQEPQTAIAIVYGLLLDSQSPSQVQQIEWLRQVETNEIVERALELSRDMNQLNPRSKLPLLELIVPVLSATLNLAGVLP